MWSLYVSISLTWVETTFQVLVELMALANKSKSLDGKTGKVRRFLLRVVRGKI